MHRLPIRRSLLLLIVLLVPAVSTASPDYAVSLVGSSVKAVRGQVARFVVRVDFLDGFTPSEPITLQAPEAPSGAASFAPATLTREGGSLLSIDTNGINPGVYGWHVQAVAGGSTKTAPFVLEVTTCAELEFYTFDSSYNKVVLPSLSPTAQGVTDVYVAGRDANGYQLDAGTPISLTSGNSGILAVYPHPDGHYRVYAIDSGSTVLTAATPDGYSQSIPVNINIPSEPRITEISVSPGTVTNRGDEMITFTATGTGSLDSVAYDGLALVDDTGYWYDDARSYIGTGYVPEGLAPGTHAYFFRAGIASAADAVRVVPLTVVNDPGKGEIRGAVYPLAPDGSAVSGRIELYDASGVLVREIEAREEFGISYVQPGTYRLRFVPTDQQALRPQWWPNADSFGSASDVAVTAGGAVEGIYFFPSPWDQPEPPRIVSTTPADGEVGVDAAASITAVFSKQMDVSTLNPGAFRLTDGLGTPVPGTVTCADGLTAVFTPSVVLPMGATYTVVVTTGATDMEGLPLGQGHSWSFSTASAADLLSEARSLADGVSVALAGKTVHLDQGVFAYIEEPDRSSGMRIEGAISNAADGSVVSLKGVMAATPGGERYIDVRSLDVTGPGGIRPLGAAVRALGNRMMDGLSVKVWGRISAPPTAASFVLSDGSDGQGATVITPTPHGLTQGRLVSVTGAAGWENGRVVHAETVTEQ